MIYALQGVLWASVRRFWARKYRDSHEAIKRRDEPVNGLYSGFTFWRVLRTDRHKRKNSRLRAVEWRTSGGKLLKDIGTREKENPPQVIPGRALVVFKIFSPSPK